MLKPNRKKSLNHSQTECKRNDTKTKEQNIGFYLLNLSAVKFTVRAHSLTESKGKNNRNINNQKYKKKNMEKDNVKTTWCCAYYIYDNRVLTFRLIHTLFFLLSSLILQNTSSHSYDMMMTIYTRNERSIHTLIRVDDSRSTVSI